MLLLLVLLLLQLMRVHCLRLVHPLRLLLRRLVHVYWRKIVRSAGRRSLDGRLLLLLRVASSELVARWLWLGMLLLLLCLGLAGSTLLIRCGATLLSFLDHGSYHCSRDAEFVAVAVEDHGGVRRGEVALAVVHQGASRRFGDGAAVVCVVLVAKGGGDEWSAEWLLMLMMMLLLLLDGLEVRRRLDCVEVWRVNVRCEVGRQSRVERVCWWTGTSMVAESIWIDAALVDAGAEVIRIEGSERREVHVVAIMVGVVVKGVWEAWIREGGVCHFARHGGRGLSRLCDKNAVLPALCRRD